MTTMVERVAAAMRAELGVDWPYAGDEQLLDVARAAIEAMRRPSAYMLDRGFLDSTVAWIEAGPEDVWEVMIECALNEREQYARIIDLLPAARRRASRIGPQHSLWEVISDAEALMSGRPTLLQGTQDEVANALIDMLQKEST